MLFTVHLFQDFVIPVTNQILIHILEVSNSQAFLSAKAIQPTTSEIKHRSPNTMSISRDRAACSSSTKVFGVEETHLQLFSGVFV